MTTIPPEAAGQATLSQPPADTSFLKMERRGAAAWLTLARPARRNALSERMLEELELALLAIREDRSLRVVVLAAEGPVFCAGHDLSEMRGRSEGAYRHLFARCTRVMLGFRQLPQPVIARVQGLATAAGCQLAAACDLVVAAETAGFATPGVKIGLFCTTPMVPLVRVVPSRMAMEMLLTGRVIPAAEAKQFGLVNTVVPAEGLDAAVGTYVDAIVSASATTMEFGKRAFYELEHLSEAEAYAQAVEIMTSNALANDAQEGISAFIEKRHPQWDHTAAVFPQ